MPEEPVKKTRKKKEPVKEPDLFSSRDNDIAISYKEIKNEIDSLKIFIKEQVIDIIKEKDKQIECHTELIQRLIRTMMSNKFETKEANEIKNEVKEEIKNDTKNEIKQNDIKITMTNDFIKIHGNTFPHRNVIKKISDAAWVSEEKHWKTTMSIEHIENIFKEHAVEYSLNNIQNVIENQNDIQNDIEFR